MTEMIIRNFPKPSYLLEESMNTLCANLTLSGVGKRKKKIMITSCRPSQGKSYVSLNLLRTMDGLGYKSILVDMDLRASKLQADYHIEIMNEPKSYSGLYGYLYGLCPLQDIIGKTNWRNADLILPGHTVAHSFRLFSSAKCKNLFELLSPYYDVIIVDTPPIGTIIDAAKVASYCDGTLFVLESGVDSASKVQKAVQQLEKTGCPLLGYVLNKVKANKAEEKYYAYYSKSDRR